MLLVYGPRSTDYDFGSEHPLTPRRFGPGIDLLRAVGAEPGLAPEPASDAELRWLHTRPYIDVVKRFSHDPYGFAAGAGIGDGGDCPPFAEMHEASAAVAGGSIRAVEAILRGDVEHALHPGGGLHHAMPGHASGFCIYNDPALAIARARRDGSRVLYLDFDVHHGDGVEAMFWADPGVLTISVHESGRTLFPGTGGVDEVGEGVAAGTSVNVPLPAGTGEQAWIAALGFVVPELAASFGPDLVVSQHGADSHAWDPLAHLNVTTTAHGRAAQLVDAVAHRFARGRWLATGGGGYDAYRVVPRTWALTWLAGAHLAVPSSTPEAWRDRWAAEAARYGQAPLPMSFEDEPNAGRPIDAGEEVAEAGALTVARLVRRALVPRLVREAVDRVWWDPLAGVDVGSGGEGATAGAGGSVGAGGSGGSSGRGTPSVIAVVDRATWDRLTLAPSVIPPAYPADGHRIIDAALRDGARVTAAVDGGQVVGLAVSAPVVGRAGEWALLALGVAPDHRRAGLAGRLLGEHIAFGAAGDVLLADVTLAERDVFEPLHRDRRASIVRSLLTRAGFEIEAADAAVRSIDPRAITARLHRA